MATLPTNYVDDQLAESMGGRRHYNMTTDAYGTYLTDVTEYTQRGSTFAAAQINETNAQVNANTTDIADKLDKTGDTQNNTTTFTSDDTSTSPSSFTSISLVSSGETHSSLFRKMSQAIKNIRWLNNNKRTTGAYDTYRDTVAFTSGDSSSASSWTDVSTLSSGLTHATLLNRISTMMKNVRYLGRKSTSYFTNNKAGYYNYLTMYNYSISYIGYFVFVRGAIKSSINLAPNSSDDDHWKLSDLGITNLPYDYRGSTDLVCCASSFEPAWNSHGGDVLIIANIYVDNYANIEIEVYNKTKDLTLNAGDLIGHFSVMFVLQ